MGQKCSALLKEKEEEALYSVAKEEEEVEEEEEKSFSGKPSSSNSFLEVRKDFLWFSREGAVVSKDDDDDDEDDKNAREERAPFFYQDEAEEKRGGDESAPRVVGNVSLVVQEEEGEEEEEEEEKKKRQRVGSKSPPKRFRWTVGEKELREATQNGDGEVTSTIFVADAHREFRLALKNSVEVEGGAAKALVSARLECCPPSSSKAANAVDVAVTMRVSLEFSKRGENGINDESRGSIVLREVYTRKMLNQGECLVLRDFFKSDIAESNATKLTTTKNKAMTSTKDSFQLVCEVDFDSLDSVASERDDEDDINTFNSSAIVAYCVSLSPLLFVFENFLHESECEFLRTLANKDLKRSRVTDGKLSNGRTSSSCFLIGAKGKEDGVKTIERRMLDAIRSTPVLTTRRFDTLKLKGSEPMQIVRYGKNEKYTSHFDNKAGSFRRVATFMCYLSDQCEGGCTNFPKAEPLFLEPSFDEHGVFKPFGRKKKTVASEQHGVKIHPKLGRAILFFSISEEPFRENPLSLHEGQTVRKGEKFICTKWLTRTEESENEEDDFVSSDEADAD
ncbi:unnamed protein product [Bathycoccus prasinos]